MKQKLRGFFFGVGIFLVELAVLYPAKLLDDEIVRQVGLHFGPNAAWVEWTFRIAIWCLIVALPLSVLIAGRHWLERRRRATRFQDCLRKMETPAQVRLAGRREWRDFRPDMLVPLVVPDAVAALDRTHGLLRLKAINHYQDSAIDLRDVIGAEWQDGESRRPVGRQSLFRRLRPKYRILAEQPRIRLEIATTGKDPLLEYFLVAAPQDRAAMKDLFTALERAARYARGSNAVTSLQLLEALPLQGSRYSYAWL